jgi:galactokinase
MTLQEKITAAFAAQFHEAPTYIVRAPGRVNLIGEHTDYNDGFVFPMAIDRAIWLALRPRTDQEVHITSLDYGDTAVFHLTDFHKENNHWIEYVKGVAWALQQAGHTLHGWEGVMSGDIPRGSGLSSSAGLELAAARAFTAVSHIPWQPAPMALLSQKAENQWVGVNCGIMDQMISAVGEAGRAILIDCRTLETTAAPLPSGTAVVILDTATRRGLVDSAYNERRQQCEAAAAFFGVPALRDVSVAQFLEMENQLDELTRKRARHVVTENQRTLNAARAMQLDDAPLLGQLMHDSHISLRDDFQVSCPELDTMVRIAQSEESCYGARMTGAGFGGCAVALVNQAEAAEFAANVAAQYEAETSLTPQIYICQPVDGAALYSGNQSSVTG